MTPDKIVARNRANAQKSTGPRTDAGKAIVAGNARRHGATGRPDPDAVLAWLEIILDAPDPAPSAMMPEDERGFRALSLAQAEVRLVMALEALEVHEASAEGPEATGDAFLDDLAAIDRCFDDRLVPKDAAMEGLRLRSLIGRAILDAPLQFARKRKLLKRYLGEARAARRRAFDAWIEINASGEVDAAA